MDEFGGIALLMLVPVTACIFLCICAGWRWPK